LALRSPSRRLPLETSSTVIAPTVERAVRELFILFGGYQLPSNAIEQWSRKLSERTARSLADLVSGVPPAGRLLLQITATISLGDAPALCFERSRSSPTSIAQDRAKAAIPGKHQRGASIPCTLVTDGRSRAICQSMDAPQSNFLDISSPSPLDHMWTDHTSNWA